MSTTPANESIALFYQNGGSDKNLHAKLNH